MDIENINIHSLLTLPISERKNLPETSGLYFVISGEEIIYIGVSINLKQRWLTHHKLKTILCFNFLKIAYILLERGDLSISEKEAIDYFRPKLNSANRNYPLLTKSKEPKAPNEIPMISNLVKLRIREVAEERGITTAYQLQKLTGVQTTVAYKWFKNDMKMIAIETIDLLCKKLKCKPADLFSFEGDK
jgi:DNA-binding Xre family transcriptional regulator